jgi:hypothetical protein
MSKIAEQKALEAYPIKEEWVGNQYGGLEDINSLSREKYQEGYDQAMQDIKEFIYDKFNIHPHDCHVIQYDSDTPIESMDDFIKQIENYIENEM